ncbi:MAG: ribosome-associated translation inhibitor RaiA [Clostridiales bacterium]|nr:ribosome-associated translation inhibitor RaiA [Clostridiales bacterium]
MKFTFNAKKVEVSEDLMEYARKKISKLERYFKKDSTAHIVFSTERGRETVEITIYHGSMIFRTRQTTQDFFASIDQGIEVLVRQIHKNKTRLEKRLRKGAFDRAAGSDVNGHQDVEEESYDIVRTKRFAIKPMSPEEAILQMNMLGHEFFVFKDETNSDSFAVVYRRNDGGYGLIETE